MTMPHCELHLLCVNRQDKSRQRYALAYNILPVTRHSASCAEHSTKSGQADSVFHQVWPGIFCLQLAKILPCSLLYPQYYSLNEVEGFCKAKIPKCIHTNAGLPSDQDFWCQLAWQQACGHVIIQAYIQSHRLRRDA